MTHTFGVYLLARVVEDVAVALAADGALVERHDVLRNGNFFTNLFKPTFDIGTLYFFVLFVYCLFIQLAIFLLVSEVSKQR